jgi:hypothetical protein
MVYVLLHRKNALSREYPDGRAMLTPQQPLIPFSLKPWKVRSYLLLQFETQDAYVSLQEVGCGICNFYQDIKYENPMRSSHKWLPTNADG